jgi:hypothetical protein
MKKELKKSKIMNMKLFIENIDKKDKIKSSKS